MNRSEMRRCGKQYATAEEAHRSKAARRPGAQVEWCRCGGYHVTRPKAPADGAPRKAARDTGPSSGTRAMVYARDGCRCVCCGLSVIGRVHSVQHRKRRSQGGTNDLSNLITVLGDGTTGCHARIDSRRDPHDEAKGYTVRSWDDPARIPVMVFGEHDSGVLVWLTPDGRYAFEPPAGAA